jgi:predicted anti-sigma-YlaC factor YlaD
MRECEKIRKNIILFIAGKLSKNEKEEIEKHLNLCADCNFYYQYLKTFFTDYEKYKNGNYWEYLTQKIMKKIENYEKRKMVIEIRVKRFAVSFLFILCLFLIILNKFQHQINIARYYHLFKDFQIVKNLDEIEEMVALEEENETE